MRAFLANFLIRKYTFKKGWKCFCFFPRHQKFVNLIDNLGVEFKSILLFTNVDWLTKETKCLPKFFRDVIFELG